MKINNFLSKYIDTVLIMIGEIVVAALISFAFLLFGKFDYTVLTGALLGGAVMVINLLILSVSINRALDQYLSGRGDKEMTEEEIEEYAKKNGMVVQNATIKSMIFRTVFMIGVLVIALISKKFNPLATVIPLLMYRPLLYVTEIIKNKFQKKRGD
jgi:hypothetical protein